jgi:hypothetical protein
MDSEQKRTGYTSGISWFALIVGIALGVGLGLMYTWEIDPVIERNTAPWQLGPEAREDYVVAVALSYAYNHDLNLAFDRLRALRPDQDVWSMVANIACARHKRVQRTNSDVLVMRALEQLYRPQGASGCADGQYPTPAPVSFITPTPEFTRTPTLTPPPTKTPTPPLPTPTPYEPAEPSRTPPPSGSYVIARIEPFCDPDLDGVIEVRVYHPSGEGVPGMPVTVTWGGDQTDTFYTGLKPGREAGYADFQMVPGRSYLVTIPGLVSDPRPIEAVPCEVSVNGQVVSATTSYWINFHRQPG